MPQSHQQTVSAPSLAAALQFAWESALKGFPATVRSRNMQWEVVVEL